MTAAAADLDEDGWTDIYVASDSTAAILYRNNHDGTFSDRALQSGTAFSENGMAQAGMGLAVGDYNTDGRLDLFKTHFADDIPALYRNLGKGLFEDVATAAGLAVQNRHVEWGAGMPDLDNDGWPDLVYVTGNVYPEVEARLPEYPYKGPIIVFRNRGGDAVRGRDRRERTGRDDAADRAAAPRSGISTTTATWTLLVMNMNEPPALLRNDYAGSNQWLAVQLRRARLEPVGHRRHGPRDRRRPDAGAGRAQPIELLQPRRLAPALRAGTRTRPPTASRCVGRTAR